jgi:hypothetical protein
MTGETPLPPTANDNYHPWADACYSAADADGDLVPYETRLARVRREAKRRGWCLERSKARSEYTVGHGLYRIVDATSGAYIAGGEPHPFSLLLKDAEALLLGAHHPRQPKGRRG